MITIGKLIDELGGPSKVAAACGVLPSAVTNWISRNAIAAQQHITVWKMAQAAGLDWAPPGADGLSIVGRDQTMWELLNGRKQCE